MSTFLAVTSSGLHKVLAQELQSLGFKGIEQRDAGVLFESDWKGCYRANLRLRSASRILYPLLHFPAKDADEVYDNIRRHDFTKYLDLKGTFAIDTVVKDSPLLRDQRYITMKIKDAIADQFTEKFGERPDVDKENPELLIWVRVVEDRVMVFIDTSGPALFKRGYRKESVPAPVKEHVAGALIQMTGWDGSVPLLDPMCGSGTFLIEGALKALDIAPGALRDGFGFQKLPNFDSQAWDEVVEESTALEKETLPFKLYGFDEDRDAVDATRKNAHAAGLGDLIDVKRFSVSILEPPVETGMIIVNPPYGERLKRDQPLLEDSYRDLGFALRTRFKGWTAWVLTNQQDCAKWLQLKTSDRYYLSNGSIECQFLKFDIRA